MSTVYSKSQQQTISIDVLPQKSEFLINFNTLSNHFIKKFQQLNCDKECLKILETYQSDVQSLMMQALALSTTQSQSNKNFQKNNDELQSFSNEQSQYSFLRNVWQNKYCTKKQQNQNADDKIDRINKIVAVIKTKINYSVQKEGYLIEKQEQNEKRLYESLKNSIIQKTKFNNQSLPEQQVLLNQYVYSQPAYLKLKQQLQRLKMQKQESLLKLSFKDSQIHSYAKQIRDLQISLTTIRKKFQQLQKAWVELSKRNIQLQQQKLLNPHSHKKLKDFRERQTLSSSLTFSGLASLKKLNGGTNEAMGLNSEQIGVCGITSMEDITVEELKKQRSPIEPRSPERCTRFNEAIEVLSPELRTITSYANNTSLLSQRLQSDKSPFRFKYIKQDSNRKALLSSVRSVDIKDNTSLTKPKFERTKQYFGNKKDMQVFDNIDSQLLGRLRGRMGKDDLTKRNYGMGFQ